MDLKITKDLTYAVVDGQPLTLDLYRPATDEDVPVVLYLHGGGYRVGDKADHETRLTGLASQGIAVASANYRLVPNAIYPAQIHDGKAAIRWLRASGSTHGLATTRIAIWGASAGGYLASMIGLTADDPDLEGTVGPELNESSSVQAVVTWFAPSDLIANSRRTWLEKMILDEPAENGLFGRDEIAVDDEYVRTSSPYDRVTPIAPPFLITAGDRDRIVPESQGRTLHDALVRNGVDSTYTLVGGAGHEDPRFDSPTNLAMTAGWLRSQLAASASLSACAPADQQ